MSKGTHGGSLRVVAGRLGGRRLVAPAGDATRPTSDRVRQATFNALDSLGVVVGARVFDGFAGSGALGIEALSRGAVEATFADAAPAARAAVEANLTATGLSREARVVACDAAAALRIGGPWDLVLLDPPYAFSGWPELLGQAADHLSTGGVVVVESDHEVALPPSLHPIRVRRYGGTVITFASHAGAPS